MRTLPAKERCSNSTACWLALALALLCPASGCTSETSPVEVESDQGAAADQAMSADAAQPDAALPDAALPDAAAPDAAPPDAAPPDAALPDAALPDAALPDAALPDAALPDAALPDAGPERLRAPTIGPLVRPTPDPPARFPADAEGCHWLFRQEHVPEFHLEISPEAWTVILWERENGQRIEDAGLSANYHEAISLTYEDVVFRRPQVRLRGNPTFWGGQDKPQLQISFDEDNPFGHFLGLRKLLFDAAAFNRSFLRDRLAMSIARDAGLPAPCVNNARLFVNGEDLGLYTLVEKIDAVFLWKWMRAPTGDLWKRADWRLRTNVDVSDRERLDALLDAEDLESLAELLDVEWANRQYAVEALMPAPDGLWAGGLNYYLYDDPTTERFLVLPWDYDGAFTQEGKYLDPLRWRKPERFHGRPWYDLMVADPVGLELYVDTLEHLLDTVYQPEVLLDRVDRWQAQVGPIVEVDPTLRFDYQRHLERTDKLRAHLRLRAAFLRDWIECARAGGRQDPDDGCLMN